MSKDLIQSDNSKTFFFKRVGCFLAILGCTQFIIITFIASVFYPGGYKYLDYFFSDLGTIRARNGELNTLSSLLFYGSFIILTSCLIPFWCIIPKIFNTTRVERNLSILGSLMGLASVLLSFGVIIYPMDAYFEEHQLFAGFFSTFLALAILLYSIAIIFNNEYSNIYAFLSLCLFIIVGLFELAAFGNYQPFVQKIIFYCFFIWIIVQIIHLWPLITSLSSE